MSVAASVREREREREKEREKKRDILVVIELNCFKLLLIYQTSLPRIACILGVNTLSKN
jgi:hypothetical protein